jgi:signal-transduction protein with cAMP-binding, CBS, and nucleotidyltransferase domain
MRKHYVGALVVTTQSAAGLHVSGVVTDRDLVIDVLGRGLSVGGVKVGELAHQDIASVSEADDLDVAVEVMQQTGVRRVLVTDADRRLVGVVSFDDIVDVFARRMAGLAKVLRSGMEREVAEAAGAPEPPPVVLRIPPMGTAGWGNPLA